MSTRTEERETFADFQAPYRQESFQIHVRAHEAEDWPGMSLTELPENDFRLGLTHSNIYGVRVEAVLDDPRWQDQLVEVPVGELNFLNLMDLRIDGFLEDPLVTASIDHRRDWGVAFEALQTLRDSSEHQRILDGYMQTD